MWENVFLCVLNDIAVTMAGFLGEYEVSIDAKGRFLLPSGFRKQLTEGEESFVINRGFENCLAMYTRLVWDKLTENLVRLNDFDPRMRQLKRLFLNGATSVEPDGAGRLLIPKPLQEFASLSKDVVFSCQGNKVELWDKSTYYDYIKMGANDFSVLAAEMSKNNLFNPFEGL
jgi:MraZ protein